jgi:hypothetical protein
MPVRKTIPEKDGVYFITFTYARWLLLLNKNDTLAEAKYVMGMSFKTLELYNKISVEENAKNLKANKFFQKKTIS